MAVNGVLEKPDLQAPLGVALVRSGGGEKNNRHNDILKDLIPKTSKKSLREANNAKEEKSANHSEKDRTHKNQNVAVLPNVFRAPDGPRKEARHNIDDEDNGGKKDKNIAAEEEDGHHAGYLHESADEVQIAKVP